MARAMGIAPSSVQAIWKAHGLKPHQVATFKLSNDPRFVEKLKDVVGCHRSRRPPSLPRHAVPRLNHSFNDRCMTFGQSHGRVAIHISAIENWAEPEFGLD